MIHTCNICLEEFNSQRALSNHMRKHSNVVYMCNEADCQLVFTSIGDFNTHNNLHKDQLQCPICQRRFYKNSALKTHISSVHKKEKKFYCEECDKGFFRKKDLKNHEQLHTGQSNYTCDVCNKSFSHISNLNRHKRLHTNIKLYCCIICNKRFTQSSTLQRHKRIHKSEIKAKCAICNKSMLSLIELKSHLVKIHNIQDEHIHKNCSRTYYCYNCGEQFEMKVDLNSHKQQCNHMTAITLPGEHQGSGTDTNIIIERGHHPSVSPNQQSTEEVAAAASSKQKVSNDGVGGDFITYVEHLQEVVRDKDDIDIQEDERDDNSEISDFSVTSSIESECVMCEGEQLQYRQNARNNEKVEILINRPRNEIYEAGYEQIPSIRKLSFGDEESSNFSTVIKRSVLFSNSTTETSKPVIQGVRSNSSIQKNIPSLPKTTLHRPERGHPCSVIKLVKDNSSKLTNEELFVRKEPSLNPTNLGTVSEGVITSSESPLRAATISKTGAVIRTSTSPPKIASRSITSGRLAAVIPRTSNVHAPTFHAIAEESLITLKRPQLRQHDNSKPVISGIPPSIERILKDNEELVHKATNSKETIVKNDKHSMISTKSSREITGEKVLRRKNLPSERETGEEEPIHEHMSHTHVVQTIRRIVKDLANPNINNTIEDDLANPNIDNTIEDDLTNPSIDNTTENNLANPSIDNKTYDNLANHNVDNNTNDELTNTNIDNTNEDLTNSRKIKPIDNITNTNNTIVSSPNIIVTNENLNDRNTIEEDINAEENTADDFSADLIIDENIKVGAEEGLSNPMVNLKEIITKPRKKYLCSVCDKEFDKPCHLQFHKGVHDDKLKKFECEICAQRFCYKSRLNYHMSTKHSINHKTFDCSLCDKQFSAPNSLKDHKKRIHCNEKSFLCKSCPKQFYKKYDLKVHTRTHTNVKPYSCKLCNKQFSHISHLYRHEKIHNRQADK